MRFAILGSGAVGGYFGAKLANAGQDVTFIARGAHLAAAPRQAFSRAQLLRDVWASSPDWQQSTTVTEIVRRIRMKIEPDVEHPRWIKTIRSVGYRFDPDPVAPRTEAEAADA